MLSVAGKTGCRIGLFGHSQLRKFRTIPIDPHRKNTSLSALFHGNGRTAFTVD